MKIPKAPIPSREVKKLLQPELRIRNVARFVGISAIISIPIILLLVIFNVIPIIGLTIIPLLGFIIYKENKRYYLYNDVVVLRRVMNDAEYKKWYFEYILNRDAEENDIDSE